jgi:hydrophobe/amphiphile efflux-1 (HAE1) family protein
MIFNLFIRRPRLAMVLSIVITLAGLISMAVIPVSQYPDIAPPTVQVRASYPGADAAVVEATVAQPLESAVNGVDNMRYMRSTSASDGSYSLSVAFELGTDPDIDTVNVQNRTRLAEASLPEEVRRTGLTVSKASPDLLQVLVFHSPDQRYDELFISNYVTLNVLDEIKRVPGVGNAEIFGARDYAMRIWIDPTRLSNLNLSPADVIAAVEDQNRQAAAGRIGAAPLSDDQRLQLTVTTKGRLETVEEFQNIVVRAQPDGAFVRLGDIARVELAAASFDSTARYNGGAAAPVGINLSSGANAVLVAEAVADRLAELEERFPEGLTYEFVYNTAEFVSAMIEKVIETLLEAFVLVALVVFVFLGRLRPTIIPLIAVPVAIIGALAVMNALGYTANTISLLALVLAIGIVVDDAIIVVENVERVMEEHPELSPAAATRKAMGEIVGPIIAITLVLLSVFVPVALLPGSSGALFREFAVAISAAMVISAINALTLSPALCSLLLRPGEPAGVMRALTRGINRIGDGYASVVSRLVRFGVAGLVVIVALALGAAWLLQRLPDGFVPDEDKGFLIVVASLPPGASLNRTDAAVAAAERVIGADPSVDSVVAVLGFDFLGGGAASNAAVLFARLKSYEERTTPDLGVAATIGRLYGGLAAIPDGSFIPVNPPAISGIGQVGGFEFMLEALQGQPPAELAATMRGLIVAANQSPAIGAAFSTFEAETPQLRLDIDRDHAQALGVRLTDVFTALQATLGGYYINDFNLYGRTWTVRLQAEQQFRATIDDLNSIEVRNASGEVVPFSTFGSARLDVGPRSLVRYNNYRAVPINGQPAPGVGMGEAIAVMEALSAGTLPAGYAYEWSGQALEQKESAGQAPLVLGLAALFAFLFLVGLYESWNVPIPVLLSVITAAVGALAALWLFGMSFDLFAQIGLVVLIALAAKNAILINAFALDRRAAGASLRESAIEGARLRFRPVMMTSFAFIFGLIPLVLADGPGAGSMVAVGIPVLAGMLAAALLGIFLIPMLYIVFQWLRERAGWRPPEPAAAGDA